MTMEESEILKLYRDEAGCNAQDLIAILDSRLDAQTTISECGSMVLYQHGLMLTLVSTGGVEFFHLKAH